MENAKHEILRKEVRRMTKMYSYAEHIFNNELVEKAYALVKDWDMWGDLFIQPKSGENLPVATILIGAADYDDARIIFEYYFGSYNSDYEDFRKTRDDFNGLTEKERDTITMEEEIAEFEFFKEYGNC